MTLLTLKYFISVVDCESFSGAARRLHITQPALSRQIALLEDEFGLKLLTRQKHSAQLTNAGKFLYEEAKDIIFQCDTLEQSMKEFKTCDRGSLRIGYVGSYEMPILSKTISDMSAENPNLKIKVSRIQPIDTEKLLLYGELDIIIAPEAFFTNASNIETELAISDQLRVIAPLGHALAEKQEIWLDELSDESFIMIDEGFDPFTKMYISQKLGFEPNHGETATDPQQNILMTAFGRSLAFTPSMERGSPDVRQVAFLNVVDLDIPFNLVFARRAGDDNPAAYLFIGKFKSQLESDETERPNTV